MNEFPVRLIKMRGGKALRTAIVEGQTEVWPSVGRPFVLIGAPLQPPPFGQVGFRGVTTSLIVEIVKDDEEGCVFDTETGSRYFVERIEIPPSHSGGV